MRSVTVRSSVALGLLAAVLAGCGGGSGSATSPSAQGGSGGAVVSGQIVRTQGAALHESRTVVALRAVLGIGLAEAAVGDPVPGVTVTLTGTGGTFTATTDANGNFLFPSVPAGTYTISVTDTATEPDTVYAVTGTTGLTVGAGDTGVIAGTVKLAAAVLTVTVAATDFADVLANDAQLAHAINVAQASQQSLEDVIAYRQAGHGWGQVAHHFNVHPGVLGLGASPDDLTSARASHGRGKGKPKA